MIPINYHHLYYFHAIARAGSITKACAELLLAQSTLSAQLKQLEKALGRRLFDRKNQRLSLTEEGRLVLDYAESIFEMGKELQDAMRDRPLAGRVAIQVGILNATPRAFGHALLECLLRDPSLANVVTHEEDLAGLTNSLKQHRLDVALSDIPIAGRDREELVNHFICRIPVVLAAAPELAARCRKFPADLSSLPFILPSMPSQVFRQVQDALAARAITPRVLAEVQDVELARRLALAGHGITPLNEYSVAASLPAGGLKIISSSRSLGIYESVYLVTRKRKWLNPLTDRLIINFRALLKKCSFALFV
ncbi:MAG: LysR family transcriptional regulator [Elusimicrobiota bacterium]